MRTPCSKHEENRADNCLTFRQGVMLTAINLVITGVMALAIYHLM